jgi:hypothetical protein
MARLANLNESRQKNKRTGDIDIYTKEDHYGLNALVQVINQLFGQDNAPKKETGARNVSGFSQIKH